MNDNKDEIAKFRSVENKTCDVCSNFFAHLYECKYTLKEPDSNVLKIEKMCICSYCAEALEKAKW